MWRCRKASCLRGRLLWMVSLLLLFVSCSKDEGNEEVEDTTLSHTVLVYMAAENSLSRQVYNDISEMLAGHTSLTANDHLLIYLDDTSLPCIYEVNYATTATSRVNLTPVKTYEEDMNSASAAVLDEVLQYVENTYPADDYGLVLWSHASGWLPNLSSENSTSSVKGTEGSAKRRTFGIDNEKNTTSNKGSQMNVADLAEVLNAHAPFRFVMFDACFMQSLEVAYELRNCADYLVGSPAEIPGPGAPYEQVMPYMFADHMDGDGLAQAYNDYYKTKSITSSYGGVMSCVHLAEMDAFAQIFRPLYLQYLDTLKELDYSAVLNYFDYDGYRTLKSMPDCYDILSVMERVLSLEHYTVWRAALDALCHSYYDTYWYSAFMGYTRITDGECGGLSFYVPLAKYSERGDNFTAAFNETSWGKYLGLSE